MSNKALLYTVFLAMCVFIALWFGWLLNRPDPSLAVLQANPGLGFVQMFDSLEDEAAQVTPLPAGQVCKKLSGRIAYHDGGPPLYFYRLDCDGHTGYVNALWVR